MIAVQHLALFSVLIAVGVQSLSFCNSNRDCGNGFTCLLHVCRVFAAPLIRGGLCQTGDDCPSDEPLCVDNICTALPGRALLEHEVAKERAARPDSCIFYCHPPMICVESHDEYDDGKCVYPPSHPFYKK
uniref:Uncharacterized protein n=1 Tax=Ditylenchus dipsaci TaxID=166011 RepID=A0A915E5L0_9BILA